MNDDERIAQWTQTGVSQAAQARMLKRPRGYIFRAQQRLGLLHFQHGPRMPKLTEAQERAALALLGSGQGTGKISRELGVREWAVRLLAKKTGFHHCHGSGLRVDISPALLAKIQDEVLNRKNNCRQLSRKYNVAYSTIKKLTRKLLGVAALAPGHFKIPLETPYPSNWVDPFRKV